MGLHEKEKKKKKKVALPWMAGARKRHHLGVLQSLGYLPALIFFSAHTNDLLQAKVRNKVRLSRRAFFSPPFNIKVREIMVSLWSFPGTAYVSLRGVYDGTDCVVCFLWERLRRWSGYGLKKGVYLYGAGANLLHANEQTSNGALELHRHLLPHCILTTTASSHKLYVWSNEVACLWCVNSCNASVCRYSPKTNMMSLKKKKEIKEQHLS